MPLSNAQLAALKADIAANTNTVAYAGAPTQIKDVPNSSDGNFAVAAWYNQAAAPAFIVWRDLPMEAVHGLHVAANMTPLGNPPTTPDLTVQVWIARCVTCQGKQLNYQGLTQGRSTAPMKKLGYRAALQDCLTSVPAGTNGALLSAGWVEIRDAAKFSATNAEKLFATGTGTSGSPADLSFEGNVSASDVDSARNLP